MSSTLESYETNRADFQRVLDAVRQIQIASAFELDSPDWLARVIRNVGLVPIPEAERTYGPEIEHLNSSSQGVIQLPCEFAKFLIIVGQQRPASYLEIGTFNGATACIAAAFLQRCRPDLRAVTVDVYPHFIFQPEIRALLPWLRYEVDHTSFAFRGEAFEAVFIDGDHSFEWAWADYQNAGRQAKICAFHDVNNAPYRELSYGGVPAVWELIKKTEPGATFHEIFEHPSEPLMGIGIRIK